MLEVAKILQTVGKTSSYNDRLAILQRHAAVPGLKEILRFIYNPYQKTGISTAKLTKAMQNWPVGSGATFVYWDQALEYFAKHQTGSDKDLGVAREFIRTSERVFGEDAGELAKAIITQDLKIGITATSLNKVFGANFIPKTGCMLGTPYGDVPDNRVEWPCIVTEKLDGVRRVLVKHGGVCRFFSRSGHEDAGLVDITREAQFLPDNYVYDGELLAAGQFDNCIAQRQATNSLANSKGKKTGLIFNIFDALPVDEFYAGKSKTSATMRKIWLGATLMDNSISILDEDWAKRICAFGIYQDLKYIKPVPILGLVHNIHDVTPIVEKIWSRGGEGVMLNTSNGLYEIKRSKALLKVKHTEEHKLQVVDILEGTGKYEDAMGAIVVAYKNSFVGVGSGFTDAQRVAIWQHPEKYLGRLAEIETFGESINAQGYVSLNCPIFKRFVGEEE